MIARSVLAAMAALGLVAAPAVGQSIDSPYDFVDPSMELWTFGGAVLTERGTLGIGPGSSWSAGIGYTLRVSGPFNLDARLAYMPTTRDVFAVVDADTLAIQEDPTVGLEQIGTADLSLLLADVSLRFDVTGPRTWHNLQPYALIGVGAAFALTSDNAAEEELPEQADLRVRFQNGVTGNIGGGLELYLGHRFTLRAEARDVLWKVHTPEGFRTRHRVVEESQWVQTAHLTLGLGYRF